MNNAATQSAASIVSTRAVHTAMAATVASHGHDLAKDLYETARRYNDEFFGGQLTALLVEITAPASPRAYATHQPKTPEGVDCVIRIAPSVVEAGQAFAHDVLLHEMIHVWQTEADKREPGYAGHGPHFAAKCNEIGAKLGLAEVGVKGRDGKPDCAQWPLNVRPAGYYGEAPRATKAVTRATKPRARRAPATPTPASIDPVALVLARLAGMTRDQRAQVRAALALDGE